MDTRLTKRDKLRAVTLVAIMVLSVVATGVGFAASSNRGGAGNTFNPGVGGPNQVVVDDSKPVVFQGEDDVEFVDGNGEQVNPSQLVGVSGDAEGQPLELPIPQNQATGQYAFNGNAEQPGVTVQTPRVTDLELVNERGVDVEGSAVQEEETLLVRAEWNFQQAEDLELVVRDGNGNDVTGDVLAEPGDLSESQMQELSGPYAENPDRVSPPGQRGTGTGVVYLQGVGQFEDSEIENQSLDAAYWAIDLSDQDEGDYTVTVEGWDNLDFDDATRSTSFSVTTESDVSLDLSRDDATRGERIPFTIRGSTAGAEHYVVIEQDDFRNNRVDAGVFRDVQDIIDRGTFDADDDGEADFAWAQVQIDEDTGLGVGQIETSFLDDATIDVNIYEADRPLEEIGANVGDTEDDPSLTINQGGLGIDSPAGTYVAGSEVDVRGTAAPGIDNVVVYARDQGDWELVDTNEDGTFDDSDLIRVDSAGEWEEEDVTLSQATDILSIPGRYRLGVVEAEDARDADGNIQEVLSTSEFSSATSTQSTVIVQEPGLDEARSFQAINGQVAVEDGTVDVEGVAPGLEDVLVVMVDTRGRVVTDRVSVDDDDTFEEDDIPLITNDGRTLNEGEIEAMIIGLGRDRVAGDGVLSGQTTADLAALENYVQSIGTGLTQDQVMERISDETTDEVASDDLAISESFRFTDGSTTIESVGPIGDDTSAVQEVETGETMVVTGLTNRKPDDNTITVEAIEGPAVGDFDTNSTDEWDLDGVWSVNLDTDDIEPGTYTIEADDGDNTDTIQVEIVESDGVADNETADENETVTDDGTGVNESDDDTGENETVTDDGSDDAGQDESTDEGTATEDESTEQEETGTQTETQTEAAG
jgi:major cell surface glycoprotein (TIGR04216 family)